MKYGYIRCSTQKQDFERQYFVLKDCGIEKFYEEKISGTKQASSRVEFDKMLHGLKAGDTVYFESMSRMARSMSDLIETTNYLANTMKVSVVFLKENITVGGKGMDAMTSLLFHIMGAFAQFERDLIADRTRQALQAKKADGIKLGRPTEMTDDFIAKARALRSEGYTYSEIATKLNSKKGTVYNIFRKDNDELRREYN